MNNFDDWNLQKKQITQETDSQNLFPKKGEVWMLTFGLNIGFEQNGAGTQFLRPALVVKKFNNRMFWVVPLSTQQKRIDFYYNFSDPEGRKVSAILAQLRLVSSKRFKRSMYSMPAPKLRRIYERLRNYLEI